MKHHSMPYCSTHQNTYKLPCITGGQLSKHCAYVSVRAANSSSTALACRVCMGRGSGPERVLYDVADAEQLLELYAVEACSLSKQEGVRLSDGTVIYPSRKRWDLATVTPHGLLVEVMGQGHSSRPVTKPNNTDDSISTRQLLDYGYAEAAVKQGWTVLWLWVDEGHSSFSRTFEKWAALLREALMYVRAGNKPKLFNT